MLLSCTYQYVELLVNLIMLEDADTCCALTSYVAIIFAPEIAYKLRRTLKRELIGKWMFGISLLKLKGSSISLHTTAHHKIDCKHQALAKNAGRAFNIFSIWTIIKMQMQILLLLNYSVRANIIFHHRELEFKVVDGVKPVCMQCGELIELQMWSSDENWKRLSRISMNREEIRRFQLSVARNIPSHAIILTSARRVLRELNFL